MSVIQESTFSFWDVARIVALQGATNFYHNAKAIAKFVGESYNEFMGRLPQEYPDLSWSDTFYRIGEGDYAVLGQEITPAHAVAAVGAGVAACIAGAHYVGSQAESDPDMFTLLTQPEY